MICDLNKYCPNYDINSKDCNYTREYLGKLPKCWVGIFNNLPIIILTKIRGD